MTLFHEVRGVLPELSPMVTFALIELLRRQDITHLRDLQLARVDWFEPVSAAEGERGVSPDALRVALSELINEAKKPSAVVRGAKDEPPPAPDVHQRECRSRSRPARRRAAKCDELSAACGAVRDLELAVSIARQCTIEPRAGPRREVEALRQGLAQRSFSEWSNSARVAAILGSCPKTWPSVVSAFRCWATFAMTVLGCDAGEVIPPSPEGLALWSTCFRCKGTFDNYISHVRLVCILLRVPLDALSDPAVERAARAVQARNTWQARPKMFIREALLARLLKHLERHQSGRELQMLFLTAYIFLLRLPSEALPMHVARDGDPPRAVEPKSCLRLHDGSISLTLLWRKNRATPLTMTRTCWCARCPSTCPVHALGKFCADSAAQQPFAGFRPDAVLSALRAALQELGVPRHDAYRTHDFRRGHAQDMAVRGSRLADILRAGDWRSAAFLSYLDRDALEDSAVREAHGGASSSDEDED